MQLYCVFRILGILMMIFSVSMLTPLAIIAIFQECCVKPFWIAFLCTFGCGFFLWHTSKTAKNPLKIRDGFLLAVLFWIMLCTFGAIPYFLILPDDPNLLTNAVFESISGFTTTGATIIHNLEALPRAALFYRQQSQFLGGMGIVVLAVAILPLLGSGGMQLYRTEMPGPMKESKLTPRIAHTAKTLWLLYSIMTLCCMLAYRAAGMHWFDALGESFTTVSTGGFSMHANSFEYYKSIPIEGIACFFMLCGACNFALHYIAIFRHNPRVYYTDEESRFYLIMLLCAILLVLYILLHHNNHNTNFQTAMHGIFNVISLATTTGFSSTPFSQWPHFLPIFGIFLGIMGGCGGSTTGGIKCIRLLILAKMTRQEIIRLLHPHAVLQIKYGQHPLPSATLHALWAFITIFFTLFATIWLLLMARHYDFLTAFSATAATLGNIGAGLGAITHGFYLVDNASKWILMFAMLAGRLEIFSVLILFTPLFWEK